MNGIIPCSERLLILVGPSGVGKDTVMTAWREAVLHRGGRLRLARRTITRPAGSGGEAHEALTDAQWQAACEAGDFSLHWRANGLAYGVRPRELQALEEGPVLLNGSRAALPAIRLLAPRCRVVQLSASAASLAERLRIRGREDEQAIEARLARSAPVQADFSVSNDGTVADCVAALIGWWDAASRGS